MKMMLRVIKELPRSHTVSGPEFGSKVHALNAYPYKHQSKYDFLKFGENVTFTDMVSGLNV